MPVSDVNAFIRVNPSISLAVKVPYPKFITFMICELATIGPEKLPLRTLTINCLLPA